MILQLFYKKTREFKKTHCFAQAIFSIKELIRVDSFYAERTRMADQDQTPVFCITDILLNPVNIGNQTVKSPGQINSFFPGANFILGNRDILLNSL
jgi:hypothetical protein